MNTILDAFKNSDSVGQAIVLLLIAASCLCWSIVGNKRFDTRNKVRQCKRFLERFGKFHFNERLRIFGELDKMKAKEPLVALTLAVREALLSTLNLNSEQRRLLLDDGKLPRPLIQSELDALRVALNREMTVQVIQMESGLTLMGTIIALAPMLGLFGTVWGVMATFTGIVQGGGRPDIAAIAPGISSALLTTVGGLFVAIPAIFANNFSTSAINECVDSLELYSEDLFSALLRASEAAPKPANAPAPSNDVPSAQYRPSAAPSGDHSPAVIQQPTPAEQPQPGYVAPQQPQPGYVPPSTPPQPQPGYATQPQQQTGYATQPQQPRTGYATPPQQPGVATQRPVPPPTQQPQRPTSPTRPLPPPGL